jgi:hypothetical protein
MREEPSEALIDLLGRLGLADRAKVRAHERHVRRLARELPLFESAWIDGLARARVLTPYQAAELNAGRGETLKVGPLIVCRRIASPGYADHFTARQPGTGRLVRLAVSQRPSGRPDDLSGQVAGLISKSKGINPQHLAPIMEGQVEPNRVWLYGPHVEGRTAADWMVSNGRFSPQVAMEIARQMAAMLTELEKAGLCHGDLAAWNLIITRSGDVILPQPGVRSLLRPEEGFAQADLPPEAYDYLAPERVTLGIPPNVDSDVYACGALWWHLLTGRPPRPGGTALAKLRAAQSAEIPDVRQLAPETPQPLAKAIAACTRREPERRPESMARLAAMLGLPTRPGRLHLAACVARPGGQPSPWIVSMSAARHSKQTPVWLAAVAGCLVLAAAIAWAVRAIDKAPAHVEVTAAGVQAPQVEVTDPDAQTPENQLPISVSPSAPSPGQLALAPGPVQLDSFAFQPGQRVSGHPARRSMVLVPPEGLVIEVEGVRFENLDFVWQETADAAAAARPALIELRASGAEFRGCSFQTVRPGSYAPAAIRWVYPADRSQTQLMLPSGRIVLSDCVVRGLSAAIDCRTLGAMAIEMTNVLSLGAGPLAALDRCPEADEPIAMTLANVTLRGPGAVLQCRYQQTAMQPGSIRIEAGQSVFASDAAAGLLSFAGPAPPTELLAGVEWTGDGSLVSPKSAFAHWQRPDGSVEVLDDSAVSIAGLVRGEVEFAGPPEAGPAASRVTRWNAPLRSADSPGADPERLRWAE